MIEWGVQERGYRDCVRVGWGGGLGRVGDRLWMERSFAGFDGLRWHLMK